MAMQKELGENVTQEDIKAYLWKTLKSGQVVPGLVLSTAHIASRCNLGPISYCALVISAFSNFS